MPSRLHVVVFKWHSFHHFFEETQPAKQMEENHIFIPTQLQRKRKNSVDIGMGNLADRSCDNCSLQRNNEISTCISRKPQYKDVYRRTIEMTQRAHTFQVNCCLKVHNARLKLLSPILG